MDPKDKIIVASGTWLYDNSVPCRVLIVKEDFMPGTGDYEDPPERRDDRHVECVSMWSEAAGSPGVFCAGQGWFLTLEEAKEAGRRLFGTTLKWDENLSTD